MNNYQWYITLGDKMTVKNGMSAFTFRFCASNVTRNINENFLIIKLCPLVKTNKDS